MSRQAGRTQGGLLALAQGRKSQGCHQHHQRAGNSLAEVELEVAVW